MPSRLQRFHHSQLPHFITFTCYRRHGHLAGIATRDLFIAFLERTRVLYRMRVYGYVVMLEHVHLLVSEPERGTIANAVQSLKVSSAKRWGKVRGIELPQSPLWQKRYYDRNVRDYEAFVEKLRYIHRNPVKRGLAERREDWRWSSFCHYACGEDCGVEMESERTAARPTMTCVRVVRHPTFANVRQMWATSQPSTSTRLLGADSQGKRWIRRTFFRGW